MNVSSAFSARASVNKVRFRDQRDSQLREIASSAASSIYFRGQSTRRLPSSRATLGSTSDCRTMTSCLRPRSCYITKRISAYLTNVVGAFLTSTNSLDTSDPEPAVVGTQIVGAGGCDECQRHHYGISPPSWSYALQPVVPFVIQNMTFICEHDRNGFAETHG